MLQLPDVSAVLAELTDKEQRQKQKSIHTFERELNRFIRSSAQGRKKFLAAWMASLEKKRKGMQRKLAAATKVEKSLRPDQVAALDCVTSQSIKNDWNVEVAQAMQEIQGWKNGCEEQIKNMKAFLPSHAASIVERLQNQIKKMEADERRWREARNPEYENPKTAC
jgi:hypothetical protein